VALCRYINKLIKHKIFKKSLKWEHQKVTVNNITAGTFLKLYKCNDYDFTNKFFKYFSFDYEQIEVNDDKTFQATLKRDLPTKFRTKSRRVWQFFCFPTCRFSITNMDDYQGNHAKQGWKRITVYVFTLLHRHLI
jgi:hypothetical protein